MTACSMCTVTASTKRAPNLGDGRTGAPEVYLAEFAVTPLYPVGRETVTLLDLNSPREFKECYHVPLAGEGLPDVVEGDLLTVAGVDYPISYVGEWSDGQVPALHIVVQEVKGS